MLDTMNQTLEQLLVKDEIKMVYRLKCGKRDQSRAAQGWCTLYHCPQLFAKRFLCVPCLASLEEVRVCNMYNSAGDDESDPIHLGLHLHDLARR